MIQVVQNPVMKEPDAILSCFEQFEEKGTGKNPPWVHAIRKAGISHFAELGFPTLQHEEWKFTNMMPVTKFPFKIMLEPSSDQFTPQEIKRFTFGGMPCNRLVFVDGYYSPKLSSLGPELDDVQMGSLAVALEERSGLIEKHLARYARYNDNAFVALNTAFLKDGAFIWLPPNKVVQKPIHLLFVASSRGKGITTHPRNLVLAEKGSKGTIIENYVSIADAAYFTNSVTEVVMGENVMVEYCKVQDESRGAFHVATVQFHQDQNSKLVSHSISTGARLARNNIQTVLDGEGIECVLNGLYVAKDEQLVDHHTVVDHAKPHCNSHEFYHGILDGSSKGVFNGKIFVRKDAQKTDAKQTNKNLLLSDSATVNTKPQLEIFADDVKCTHGATVGQLDEEAIFYLRSRGIGIETARQMLVYAFASSILDKITLEPVREQLERMLLGQLAQHYQSGESP